MNSVNIFGGVPLNGSVDISGSLNLAYTLLYASSMLNCEIILENVPYVEDLLQEIKLLKKINMTCEWVGKNTLVLNGSTINSYELDYELSAKSRLSILAVPSLLHRYGKACVSMPNKTLIRRPVNRLYKVFEDLGFNIEVSGDRVKVESGLIKSDSIGFTKKTHIGTILAILTALISEEKITINNVSQDPTISELVDFLVKSGVDIEYDTDTSIKVGKLTNATNQKYRLSSDINETVFFSTLALTTKGNINIRNVNKAYMFPYTNFLTKINANFEYTSDSLKVWYVEDSLKATNVSASCYPNFMSAWISLAVLLLTQCEGESIVVDNVYVDSLEFTKTLNIMGASINLHKPSDFDLDFTTLDDSYDYKTLGEPLNVAHILGPSKLKGTKLILNDLRFSHTLLAAALTAEGKSQIYGIENVLRGYEDLLFKLKSIGAYMEE